MQPLHHEQPLDAPDSWCRSVPVDSRLRLPPRRYRHSASISSSSTFGQSGIPRRRLSAACACACLARFWPTVSTVSQYAATSARHCRFRAADDTSRSKFASTRHSAFVPCERSSPAQVRLLPTVRCFLAARSRSLCALRASRARLRASRAPNRNASSAQRLLFRLASAFNAQSTL